MKIELVFAGWDSWDRPVYLYRDKLYVVDVAPNSDTAPALHTKCSNEFDGEPDSPIRSDVEIEFVPKRATWH